MEIICFPFNYVKGKHQQYFIPIGGHMSKVVLKALIIFVSAIKSQSLKSTDWIFNPVSRFGLPRKC